MNARWTLLIVLYAAFGVAGAWYLADSTSIGADLATYQRAGEALWSGGDPYTSAASVPEDYRYRYPPLLAILMPILGWPPLWYSVVGASTAVPILVAWRVAGPAGLLPAALLIGAWGQQLLNGNAQAIVVALLVAVPFIGAWGGVALALATMLKLHPVLALVWFAGRREWQPLAWYLGAAAVLALVQLPWLPAMLDFYLGDPLATETIPGMSLRAIGVIPWVAGTLLVAAIAVAFARTRYGWLLATVLQLVALPRVLLVNLAILLAAPLPPRHAEDRVLRAGPPPTPPARPG